MKSSSNLRTFLVAIFALFAFALFAQTTEVENYAVEKYSIVAGFVYMLVSDVFHVVLSDVWRKSISVLISLVVITLACWHYGYNPFSQGMFLASISFFLSLIKKTSGVSLSPGDLIGLFKKIN